MSGDELDCAVATVLANFAASSERTAQIMGAADRELRNIRAGTDNPLRL
jgi:hypothetical protein